MEYRQGQVTLSRYSTLLKRRRWLVDITHTIPQVSASCVTMAPGAILLPSSLASEGQELVRNFIDTVLIDLLDQLSLPPSDARPSITLRSRPRQAKCVINPRNGALEAGHWNEGSYRSYSWPGNTAYDSWKFSMGTFSRYIASLLRFSFDRS